MVASVSSVLHVWNSCRTCSSQSCASLVCSADSSLITFLAPRSDPSTALIVPQPWLPDDRDRSFCAVAAPRYRGATIGFYSCIGFAAGFLGTLLFGVTLDQFGGH